MPKQCGVQSMCLGQIFVEQVNEVKQRYLEKDNKIAKEKGKMKNVILIPESNVTLLYQLQ